MSKSKEALPASWTTLPIGEVGEVRLGRQRSPDKAVGPNQIPYLRAANVTWNGLDLSDVKLMSFTPSEQQIYGLRSGDILLSEASGSVGEVGKPAVWSNEIEGCCFQNTLIRLRPPAGMSRFLYLQLLHFARSGRFVADSRGVGIHHIGAERFSSIPVRIPSLREQARIVAAVEQHLSDIDAGVVALERALARLKQYRASVLNAACEGRLVPTEAAVAKKEKRDYEPADVLLKRILRERRARWEADQLAKTAAKGQTPKNDAWRTRYEEPPASGSGLPRLPNGWHWTTVNQLSELVTKGSSPNWQGFEYCDDGILFVRSQNIGWGIADLEKVARLPEAFNEKEKKSVLREGDVLLNIVGASIGRAAVAPPAVDGANINQAVALIRLLPNSSLATYLVRWLISSSGQTRIHQEKVDVARANLSLEDVSNLPVPLPPLAEQHRIVAEVDRLLSTADETEQTVRAQLARAARLRQSVLKRAFEGKLVPQDPTDEPATVLLERIRAQKTAAAETELSKPAARGRRT